MLKGHWEEIFSSLFSWFEFRRVQALFPKAIFNISLQIGKFSTLKVSFRTVAHNMKPRSMLQSTAQHMYLCVTAVVLAMANSADLFLLFGLKHSAVSDSKILKYEPWPKPELEFSLGEVGRW